MSNTANNDKKEQLTKEIKSNQQFVAIFEAEAFEKEWELAHSFHAQQQAHTTTPAYELGDTNKTTGLVLDAAATAKFTKMAFDMGLSGQVMLKMYDRKPYVVYKSTINSQHFVTTLRQKFGTTSKFMPKPTVVQMAVGNAQMVGGAARGGMITFAIFTAVNIMDYIIRDKDTFARLAGVIAVDFAKISAATISGIIAHTITAATLHAVGVSFAAALTLGPIGVAIVAGIGIGMILSRIDKNYGVTEKLIHSLEKSFENTKQFTDDFKQGIHYIETNPVQSLSRMFGIPMLPY